MQSNNEGIFSPAFLLECGHIYEKTSKKQCFSRGEGKKKKKKKEKGSKHITFLNTSVVIVEYDSIVKLQF